MPHYFVTASRDLNHTREWYANTHSFCPEQVLKEERSAVIQLIERVTETPLPSDSEPEETVHRLFGNEKLDLMLVKAAVELMELYGKNASFETLALSDPQREKPKDEELDGHPMCKFGIKVWPLKQLVG